MPTDVALALEKRLSANASATDFPTAIFLVPLALCLFSVVLALESPAFAAVIAVMGAE